MATLVSLGSARRETTGKYSYRKVNKAEFRARVMGEASRQPRGITLTGEQQDVWRLFTWNKRQTWDSTRVLSAWKTHGRGEGRSQTQALSLLVYNHSQTTDRRRLKMQNIEVAMWSLARGTRSTRRDNKHFTVFMSSWAFRRESPEGETLNLCVHLE